MSDWTRIPDEELCRGPRVLDLLRDEAIQNFMVEVVRREVVTGLRWRITFEMSDDYIFRLVARPCFPAAAS